MKTRQKKLEAVVLSRDQLYLISGGNDGECDPIRCEAYDAGLWVGEAIKIFISLFGFAKALKSSK